MAETGRDAIGILFGVEGGGSINGKSGDKIKKQLTNIANHIKLEIKVNEKFFDNEVKKLKDKIEKELGTLDVKFKTKEPGKGSGGSGGEKNKKSADSVVQLTKAQKESLRLEKQLASERQKLNKIKNQASEEYKRQNDYVKELEAKSKDLSDEANSALNATAEQTEEYKKQVEAAKKLIELKNTIGKAKENPDLKNSALYNYQKAVDNALRIANDVDPILDHNAEAQKKVEELRDLATKPLTGKESLTEIIQKTNDLKQSATKTSGELRKLQGEADTFGNRIQKSFDSKIVERFAAVALAAVANAFRLIYQNVLELDRAVTNLQVATGKSRGEVREMVKEYAGLAKQLGVTITDITDAADTWLRQGYEIAEVNELIIQTTMLSKLGQLESAEAARALTSAMKGYKVSVEEASKIVDKFTAVDMEAATSAGDIATAMSETSASAQVAGISMDRLIGYITTVSEVTQDAAESVGTFYKTLFARMGNIKAGKFIDEDTGESLSDVESVLGSVGISLRDGLTSFRDFSDVLDEVGNNWDSYNDVQKHALATAFAGTRQQEKFIVLMENYGDALKYAEVAANSAGTAQEKYQEAVLSGIDASINSLKSGWQDFSTEVLNSDVLKTLVDAVSIIVELLAEIAKVGNGVLVTIPAIAVGLSAIVGIIAKIKTAAVFTTMWTTLKGMLNIFPAIIAQLKAAYYQHIANTAATKGYSTALLANMRAMKAQAAASKAMAATNKVGWIMLAASFVYGLIKGISDLSKAEEDRYEASKKRAEEAKEFYEGQKESLDELTELTKQYDEIASKLKNGDAMTQEIKENLLQIQKDINKHVGAETDAVDLVNGKYEEQLALIYKIRAEEAEKNIGSAGSYYQSMIEASDNAMHNNRASIEGTGEGQHTGYVADDGSTKFNLVFERGKDASQNADAISRIIENELEGGFLYEGYHIDNNVIATTTGWMKDKYYGVFTNFKNAQDAVYKLSLIIGEIDKNGWAITDNEIYQQLIALRSDYQKDLDNEQKAKEAFLTAVTNESGYYSYSDSLNVDDKNSYEEFKDKIIERVKENSEVKHLLENGSITEDDLEKYATDFVQSYYSTLYHKFENPSNIGEISLSYMIGEVEDEFEFLQGALEDMAKDGFLNPETITTLFKEFPELAEKLMKDGFLKETKNGYELIGYSTSKYFDEIINGYEEVTNAALNNYRGVEEAYRNGNATYEEVQKARLSYEQALNNEKTANTLKKLYGAANEAQNAFIEMFNTIEGGFDALSSAMDDMDETGILSADTLSNIMENYPDLIDYLEMTAQGYILADNALMQYLATLRISYVEAVNAATKGTEEYAEALQKLNMFDAIVATKMRDRQIKSYTDNLEKQKDALEEQKDRYKELVDIRKDLLKTFKEELDYQKELADKQKNVADLRTQLALARLDTTAAGRAKVRELEAELKEAEEELEDFTLEHAVDMLTDQMEDDYDAYESFIKKQVDRLTKAIENAKDTIVVNVEYPEVEKPTESEKEVVKEYIPTSPWRTYEDARKAGYGGIADETIFNNKKDDSDFFKKYHNIDLKALGIETYQQYLDYEYDNLKKFKSNSWKSYQDAAAAGFSNILGASSSEVLRAKRTINPETGEPYGTYQAYLDAMYKKYMGKTPIYHTGGFVGGSAVIKSNEEFAKLLKGEFVSTPAQMKTFMQKTLPKLASYGSGNKVTYNAPLVKIECESITEDTLPAVEEVVNQAVKKIKSEFDSALSRTGYRKGI